MRGVVHCKRLPYQVYIGRPSKWGNPFVIGEPHPVTGAPIKREEAIELYAEWIRHPARAELLASVGELRGKVLGCWCAPLACHGDVLKQLAENCDE